MPSLDTERDDRFSEPDAPATPWETTRAILETAELSWLSTVRWDGRPHVCPLVTVWLDDALHFASGPDEQKVRNLDHNPHVAVTTGTDAWEYGIDVTVEGRARRVTDHDRLTRLAAVWRERWDGRWVYEPQDGAFRSPGGVAYVYEVAPAKVIAFAKSPFAQTRHRFPVDEGSATP